MLSTLAAASTAADPPIAARAHRAQEARLDPPRGGAAQGAPQRDRLVGAPERLQRLSPPPPLPARAAAGPARRAAVAAPSLAPPAALALAAAPCARGAGSNLPALRRRPKHRRHHLLRARRFLVWPLRRQRRRGLHPAVHVRPRRRGLHEAGSGRAATAAPRSRLARPASLPDDHVPYVRGGPRDWGTHLLRKGRRLARAMPRKRRGAPRHAPAHVRAGQTCVLDAAVDAAAAAAFAAAAAAAAARAAASAVCPVRGEPGRLSALVLRGGGLVAWRVRPHCEQGEAVHLRAGGSCLCRDHPTNSLSPSPSLSLSISLSFSLSPSPSRCLSPSPSPSVTSTTYTTTTPTQLVAPGGGPVVVSRVRVSGRFCRPSTGRRSVGVLGARERWLRSISSPTGATRAGVR